MEAVQKVSIIVPVKDEADTIKIFLEAISNQEYDQENYEVIIIDDGSKDESVDIIKEFPVKLLAEPSHDNPYIARNKGLGVAEGEFIALIDVNKVPEPDWLKNGIQSMIESNADLVGGNIRFQLSEDSTASEILDAISFNDNAKLIETEGASVTGNLFFKKNIIHQVGYFPEKFRSGMDIWWTREAVKKGFKLIYSERAIVTCKPRNFTGVMKKSYRIGKTHPFNQMQNDRSFVEIIGMTLRTFSPPRLKKLKDKVNRLNVTASITNIWIIAWLSKIMMGFGRVYGMKYVFRVNIQ